ncbi:MAG: helicase, partial [Aeromicrobium sp.]|nr:helicase [Aeromicrobium sp.]
MARRGQNQAATTRNATRNQRRARNVNADGIMSVLARAVRDVEAAVQRGPLSPSSRTKYQVVALLAREERTRVKDDSTQSEGHRTEQLRRLDGIGTILAKTAARDPSLLSLLAEDAVVSDAALTLKDDMLKAAGLEAAVEIPAAEPASTTPTAPDRQVVPQSVVARQLANPFLTPDFSAAAPRQPQAQRLASWELLGPLLSAFERAAGGAKACMALPEPSAHTVHSGPELMRHQAQLVEAAAEGHRTFLLADEPGLGKTAQALLAAQAANAFPLLVVVPNVVKTNWAREAEIWTPNRPATVIHGNGDTIDAFADIVIVNYEVLDRHVGWLGDLGFRGMVVDEAHFIKNKTSQRSQHVLQLADRIRARIGSPLLMALTGTPLINDIEDFRAIWQ